MGVSEGWCGVGSEGWDWNFEGRRGKQQATGVLDGKHLVAHGIGTENHVGWVYENSPFLMGFDRLDPNI